MSRRAGAQQERPAPAAALPPFAQVRGDGLALMLRVKAGAKRAGLMAQADTPSGPRLQLAVQAPAEKGKANRAVADTLAAALGVARSDVTIASGAHGRDKRVVVEGAPVALTQALRAWLADHLRDFAPPSDEGAPP